MTSRPRKRNENESDRAAFKCAIAKNFKVRARGRMFWFVMESLVPVFFVALMVVPSLLIEEKHVLEQLFTSRPIADPSWAFPRALDAMEGGKYRIAYTPSADLEVRDVAKRAAMKLVCDNAPISFGAVVSLNAKYVFRTGSTALNEIPELLKNSSTSSSSSMAEVYEVLSEVLPESFVEREDVDDVNFLSCDEKSAEAILYPVSNAQLAESLAMDPKNKILMVVNVLNIKGNDVRYEIRANATSGIASGKQLFSGSANTGGSAEDRNDPFAFPFQKWVSGVSYDFTKYYGFLNVQSCFNAAFTDYFSSKKKAGGGGGGDVEENKSLTVEVKASAFPKHDTNIAATIASAFFSLAFVLAFAVPLSSIAKSTAYESSNNLKLQSEILGCSRYVYWTSWFLAHYLPLLVVSAIIALVGKNAFPLLESSITFLFFAIWSAQLVVFGLFLSASVGAMLNKLSRDDSSFGISSSSASVASLVSVFAYVVTWVSGVTATTKNADGSSAWLFACFLSPASALHVFGEIVSACERHGREMSWDTFADDDMFFNVTVRGVFLLVIVNFFAFGLLLYIFFARRKNVTTKYKQIDDRDEYAIRVTGIKKRILKDVNFRAKKGSVCALLGHNGAGKTTLVSVLTGLESCEGEKETFIETSGSVGFCPQFDFLWPMLTVREHLNLRLAWSRKKNINDDDDDVDTIEALVSKLGFAEKIDEQIQTLSGGQKRKVSLLLSLLNSSIAILDEPTSNMDPVSKRLAWKMISEFTKSKNNTVVLATHGMDEVETLADELVVLHNGRSMIDSVSVEEMKKYGSGYKMTYSNGETFNAPNLDMALRAHKEVLVHHKDDAASECEFDLVSVNEPSLEEAFLNFIALEKEKEEENKREVQVILGETEEQDTVEEETTTTTTKYFQNEFMHQWKALFRARFLVWKRQPLLALFCIIGCAIFFTIGLALAKSTPKEQTSTFSAYSSDMQPILFLGEAKPLLSMSSPSSLMKSAPLPMSFYASVRATEQTAQYECQETSFLLPTCRNVTACVENHQCTNETDIEKNTIDYEMMKRSDFTSTRSCGSKRGRNSQEPAPCAFYHMDAVKNTITIAASPTAYHALPAALKLFQESIFAQKFNQERLTLTLINKPLPLSKVDAAAVAFSSQSMSSAFVAMCAVLGLSVTSSILTPSLVRERTLGFKHALLCAGLSTKAYWFATATFDFVAKTLPSLLLSFVMCVALQDGDAKYYAVTIVLGFMAFTFQSTPIAYLSSLVFSDDVASFATQAAGSFALSVFFIIAAIVLDGLIVAGSSVSIVSIIWNIVGILFCASPQYGFARMFYNLSRPSDTTRIERKKGAEEDTESFMLTKTEQTRSFFEWDNNGRELLFMFLFGLLYWFIFLVMEMRSHYRIKNAFEEEETTVSTTTSSSAEEEFTNTLSVVQLKKQYRKEQTPSVDSISFTVEAKEAFALCGVNGAGKTTSFAMLTGLIPKSDGRVFWSSRNKTFGYCAQTNGVENYLTPVEHLELFANVTTKTSTKKTSSSSSSAAAAIWCEKFQSLEKHKNVLTKNLSGGAKRELCVALALSVAETSESSSLVLLDEPTAGVDPFAKTKLWKAVQAVMKKDKGCAVVITSHDIFECEKVCSSIGLLRDGKFLLCGNTDKIKSDFSKNAFSLSYRALNNERAVRRVESRNRSSSFENLFTSSSEKQIIDASIRDFSLEDVFIAVVNDTTTTTTTTTNNTNKDLR